MVMAALVVFQVSAQTSAIPDILVNYPDTIVTNGKIVTMDNKEILSSDPGRIVESIAILDGKVLAVGSTREMMALASPDTRVIDVKGKTVIPGIIETHVHPEGTMNAVRLFEKERDEYSVIPGLHTAILLPSSNPADTFAEIAEFIRQFPPEPGEWVHIRLLENEDTDFPDIGSLTNAIYRDVFNMQDFSKVIPNNPATLSSGTTPSAIVQPGLVVRARVGADGKAVSEALQIPKTLINSPPMTDSENPFEDLFKQNADADRLASYHAHIEQGCGFSEEYPHHMQHCSHRNILMNQMGLDATVKAWPGFIKAANDVTGLSPLGRTEGTRGIVGGVFQESSAWERTVFPTRMPRNLNLELMDAALQLYGSAGVTMIASSVELGVSMTAAWDLLRRDNRLPVRWGFGFEMFRSPLLYPNNALTVVEFGAHHGSIATNNWFWPMGITDGGVGDSRQVACFGDDLPGPQQLKDRELCWNDEAYRITNVLIPAVKAGFRPFSLHSFGSEAFRKHVKWIEQARVEGRMSMDDIRALRIGFAHGGAVGQIPDVVKIMKEYGLYVPLQPNDVAASLTQVKRYGPEGLEFLAPTKTLLEAGVNVVGETEYTSPRPDIYFNALDMFVNRRVRHESQPKEAGEIVMPEEAINRATALRLYGTRAAEWLFAEDYVGSLEPGKFADFTVMDRDYFTVPADEILDNKIIFTVVGDKIIYHDPEYQPVITNGAEIVPVASVSSR
jgi:predicted amidohydrolase YtcJ